jgi:DNA-binding transcriptional ArsR family regulator
MMEELHAITALSALAQPTRLAVFRALVQAGPNGMAAGDLAVMAQVPASTLSTHLRILENAGLTISRRRSRYIFHAVRYETARQLIAYLMEDCCAGHPDICGGSMACEPEGIVR